MNKLHELMADIDDRIAKRTLRGRVGLLGTLEREHHELDCILLSVLERARDHQDGDTILARQRLFSRLKVALRSHTRAEEQALYELVRQKDAAREAAAHCSGSHRQIEHLLRRLESIGESEARWLSTLATLQMKVAEHIKEEEEVFFDLASLVLGEAVLLAIETAYASERLRMEAMLGQPSRKRLDAFA